MRKFARVEGSQNLVRDLHTGAILNTDKASIVQAKKAKALRQSKNEEVQHLKEEVREIKEMLTKLIEKL